MFEMLYQIFALKMCSLPTIASHSVHNIVSVCLFDSSYMRINFVPFKWLEQHSNPSIWAGNNFYFFPFYSYVVHIIFNHKEKQAYNDQTKIAHRENSCPTKYWTVVWRGGHEC